MKLRDEINLDGVFSGLADPRLETKDFLPVLDKISGLAMCMVEETARDDVFASFKDAKVLIGNSNGTSQEVLLSKLSNKTKVPSIYSKWRLTEEEAGQLIAFDVTSRAIQEIQYLNAQHEWKLLKHIESDLPAYLTNKYVHKIAAGKLVISNIKYIYSYTSESCEDERRKDDYGQEGHGSCAKIMAALSLFGKKETPAAIMFSERVSDLLDRVMRAVSAAMNILRRNCVDKFNYLVALIEASLLARDRQREKSPSKKTFDVQRDMGAIFINPLQEIDSYNAQRYKSVFSPNYDPFKIVGCGGDTGAARKKRSIYKKQLLEVFLPLLRRELQSAFRDSSGGLSELSQMARSGGVKNRHAKKQDFLKDIADIVTAIRGWIESIGYKKTNLQKAQL